MLLKIRYIVGLERKDTIMESNIHEIGSRVSFYNIAFDGEYGWFCDVYTNTLCRINTDTASITIEAMIPFDRNNRPFQYGFIAKVGGILVLAPRSSFAVLLYDIMDKTFRRIELETKTIDKVEAYNLFCGVKIYGSNVYLIPGRFPGIVRLNLVSMEVTYLNDWYEPLKKKIHGFDSKRVMFARCNCRVGNKLYLPCWQGNIVMVFDLERESCSFLELSTYNGNLSSICIIDNKAWLASGSSNIIVRADREGKEIDRITLEGIKDTSIAFLAKCGQLLYVVPTYGDSLICLDLETEEYKKVCDLLVEAVNVPEKLVIAKTNMLSCVKDDRERIWMYSIFDGKIYRCGSDGNVDIYDAVLEKQEDERKRNIYHLKAQMSENILIENDQCSLEEFLGVFREE